MDRLIRSGNLGVWDLIHQLHPPTGVFLSGPAPIALKFLGDVLDSRQITIAEIDNSRMLASKNAWGISDHTERLDLIVDSTRQKRPYHVLSLASESGLIPSEDLRPFWRNITEKHAYECTTEAIEDALADVPGDHPNWLVLNRLDCEMLLNDIDAWPFQPELIFARTAADDFPESSSGLSTTKGVQEILVKQGYVLAAQFLETHPHIYQLVFTKNWRHAASATQLELQETQSKFEKIQEQLAEHVAASERQLGESNENLQAALVEAATSKNRADEEIAKLKSDLNAANQQVADADGRALLLEQNLADLRRRQENLSDQYVEQSARMSKIKGLLMHLSTLESEKP